MTFNEAKASIIASVARAREKKGSQRIYAVAMVDTTQYVEFYVPEWFVALNPTNYISAVGGLTTNAKKLERPKPTTTGTQRINDSGHLKVVGGSGSTTNRTSTSRNVRKPNNTGNSDPDLAVTQFIGKKVKLIFDKSKISQTRNKKGATTGTKYSSRSVRVPAIMSSDAVLRWLQTCTSTQQTPITFYVIGKTRYPMLKQTLEASKLGILGRSTRQRSSAS